ncbi:beta-D-glucuronidase [Escherichia coli]|uniref:Beta-D-glucuronidase n=1 Tax=Escherichia coli TaxID=562 RepID=A0A376W810_ECOLX|nr:beta-D-glucuronidase [Escherichia coli]
MEFSPILRPRKAYCAFGGNKKGIFTRDRKPKSAAFLLQKRWTGMNFGEKPQQGGKQ